MAREKGNKMVLRDMSKSQCLTQMSNNILQQSPCDVFVGTGSAISQYSHMLHLLKASNIHIKQDNSNIFYYNIKNKMAWLPMTTDSYYFFY